MASGREQLGDTSSVEAGLGQTESRTQTSTTSADYDCVVFMVLRSMSIEKKSHFRMIPETHDDWVLLGNWPSGLLCSKRVGAIYQSLRFRQLATGIQGRICRRIPAGRVEEKSRRWSLRALET